jgi:sirohydrochlorin cobaltochelatase
MGEPRSVADLGASALLLCAHGRGSAAEDHHVPETLARTLRERGHFRQVEACYLRGHPALSEVIAAIGADSIYLVPLLMAEGHTSQVVLPEALAAAGVGAARVRVTLPIGVSASLASLVMEDALARCRDSGWAPGDTTVVIAAHGTPRHAGAARSAERLAERVAGTRRFRRAVPAFLEQEPSVEAALRAARPGPCVVIGFFMDHGGHSAEDIPRLIAAAHPEAAYGGALGAHPGLADIILEMVLAAAAPRP